MALVSLMLGAVAAAAAKGNVEVVYPPGKEELFKISIDGEVWFENNPVWFLVEGTTFSSKPGAGEQLLRRVGSPVSKTGADKWGTYTQLTMAWKAGEATIETSTKVYTSGIVTFTQAFPDGLNVSGSLDNDNGVASGFPSFRPSTLGSQPASNQRLWMAYNGWDCFDLYGCVSAQASRVALGRWDDGTTVLPYGMEGSGPLAVMAHDGSVSAVLSASAGFMASSQALLRPPPPPAAKVAYHGTPESYWVTGDRYAATADNVSLAQCEALCQSTSCLRFDYAPGWPRSTTCGGAGETLCHNCRVVGSGGSPTLHSSGQGYTAYCVADSTGKACASGDGPGVLTYGLMGSITQVDPGFSIEIMLSVGNGVNAAVRGWGGQLTSRYNKVNPEDKDFTTTHLGYDTDNGAYYYYNPEPNRTYDQTLRDVHAYAKRVGIPYRHVQLDSWWYIKDPKPAGNGAKSWTPAPGTFPDGLAAFHEATGWNITAHNRMWSSDNVYATQNGGQYKWYLEGKEGVPLEQRFWNDLLANATAWGMYVYEQDWLFTEFVGTNKTRQSATLAREWLLQMGAGAEASNRVIQYCMLWPRFALQSLEIPAVTTARGSTDYAPGHNDQWIMGLSSLFLDSLALRPTKDNYFSTDSQGNGQKGVERYNRLQAVVSTLSTGPVFPSDAINDSDVGLILRACMADGRLLRPDRAATNLDSNILAKAVARADGTPEPGEVESTTVTLATPSANLTYTYVLAANTAATTVALAELYPTESTATFVGFESNTTASLFVVDAAHPLTLPAGDRWSFQFVTLCPVLKGGWVFQGEASTKWIAVSRQRFGIITATDSGLSVPVTGAPGETVVLGYSRLVQGKPALAISFNCVIPASGSTVAAIPGNVCSP